MAVRMLVITWLLLMTLTGLAGVIASTGEAPGMFGLFALGVVVIGKARLILTRYLRLNLLPAFLGAFTAVVALIVSIGILALSIQIPPITHPTGAAVISTHPTK